MEVKGAIVRFLCRFPTIGHAGTPLLADEGVLPLYSPVYIFYVYILQVEEGMWKEVEQQRASEFIKHYDCLLSGFNLHLF